MLFRSAMSWLGNILLNIVCKDFMSLAYNTRKNMYMKFFIYIYIIYYMYMCVCICIYEQKFIMAEIMRIFENVHFGKNMFINGIFHCCNIRPSLL